MIPNYAEMKAKALDALPGMGRYYPGAANDVLTLVDDATKFREAIAELLDGDKHERRGTGSLCNCCGLRWPCPQAEAKKLLEPEDCGCCGGRPCKGLCGCQRCREDYADFLSAE